MKTDNASIVHRWAQQKTPHGKTSNGNLSFEGPSLYSYRTEIARFIEGKVIYTRKRYSVTTSGKHQNKIPQAVSQYPTFTTMQDMTAFPAIWKACKPILLKEYRETLLQEVESLRKCVTNTHGILQDIRSSAFRLRELGDKRKVIAELCSTSLATHLVVKKYFKIDVSAKIEKARLSTERKEAVAREKEKEKLAEWRKGEKDYYHFSTTALRLNGDRIETTHGASISIPEAKMLYENLPNITPGLSVGEFTVRELTDTHIVIGCHTIPLEEIQAIAVVLGLKQAA